MTSFHFRGPGRHSDPEARADAARASKQADSTRREMEGVEARLDKLTLVCEAMWQLLRDKTGLSDAELVEQISQLDAADGKMDGMGQRAPVDCPSCGRTISARHVKCMYCGAYKSDLGPFDLTR
jgi:hypothetical protein